jgi:tetratricopeptide (TPR) repeat protein
LPDSQIFEDWLTVERAHYRRLAVRGFSTLSRLLSAERNYYAAIDPLNQALAFDPLQEDLQRERIRLLYLAGDRPAAIRAYDQLRRLLDEELGMPPMAETRALYDDLINDRLTDSGPDASYSMPVPHRVRSQIQKHLLPFVGRRAEIQRLQALSNKHRLVIVEGEPGIGKTRLIEEFMKAWRGIGLTGAARELEKNIPYQPISEALRSLFGLREWANLYRKLSGRISPIWLHELARLLPEIATPGDTAGWVWGEADESRLWEAVHQFLLALAQEQPVAIFIDDLQWADTATLGLLGYLLRQPDEKSPNLIAASRGALPRSPLITLQQTLSREDHLAKISLKRLSLEEINAITTSLTAPDAGEFANWLMKNSEGIPFVISELVRHAIENEILVGDRLNMHRLSGEPVVPQTVYSLIHTRLDRLSDAARRILDAAVAAGREFGFDLVAAAAALSESAALDAISELLTLNLIHPVDEEHFRFDHNLTMEVAYREAGEVRHRILHRRLAESMVNTFSRAELESRAGIVAYHFAKGNALHRAAPYAIQAGQQAAKLAAWVEAIAFFEMALRGLEGQERIPALMALGNIRLRAGPLAQSSEIFHEALNLAEESLNQEIIDSARLALGQSLLSQARYEESIQLARQVLETGLSKHKMDAEFLWGTALSLEGADLESAAAHLQAAEVICCDLSGDQVEKRSGIDPSYLARIRFEMGSVAAQQGNLERAVELYRQAMLVACENKSEATIIWCVLAHNNLAYHLHLLKDSTAEYYAVEGLRLAEEYGLFGQQPYLFSTLGEIALSQGLLDEAENYFTRGLTLAERLALEERLAGLTANLGLVALQQGKTDLASQRLSSALKMAESIGTLHLAARIQLWLVPLLPRNEARITIQAVHKFAQNSGRVGILAEVARLKQQLNLE